MDLIKLYCKLPIKTTLNINEKSVEHDFRIVNFIEVNPLAGLNYITSDLPIMCNLKGKSFNSLIKDIIMSAQKRIGKKSEKSCNITQ